MLVRIAIMFLACWSPLVPSVVWSGSKHILAVKGEAYQEDYNALGQLKIPLPDYRIAIQIDNLSSLADVPFDELRATILTKTGNPFVASLQKSEKEKILIRHDEPLVWSFTTNGYATELIEKSLGEPLFLVIELTYQGQVSMDPIYAQLPKLETLPQVGAIGRGRALRFTILPTSGKNGRIP